MHLRNPSYQWVSEEMFLGAGSSDVLKVPTWLKHFCYWVSTWSPPGEGIFPSVQPRYWEHLKVSQWVLCTYLQCSDPPLPTPFMCQMSLSSGGTLSMLSISSRAPASSWALGLYAPSDCRFFLAVSTIKVKPMISINTQKQSSGMATTSQGIPCLWACFCKGTEGREFLTDADMDQHFIKGLFFLHLQFKITTIWKHILNK